MSFKVTVNSFIKEVERDIAAEDKRLRNEAGLHVMRAIERKINKIGPSIPGEPPGMVTGALKKGLAVKSGRSTTLVGIKNPGYYARMLEFGTSKMAARPFLFPTFAEEAGAVKRILSGKRV